MFHSLRNEFLYSAYKIESIFKTASGKEISRPGTCFFVRNIRQEVCLVTNRHLVDADFKQSTSKFKDFTLSKVIVQGKKNNPQTNRPDDENILEIHWANLLYHQDSNNDIAVFKNIRAASPSLPPDFIIPYHLIATQEQIEGAVRIGDFVSFPGFSEWYDKKENRPLLRSGTIASDPRYNYSDNKYVLGDCIAYEAFSTGGSSGSPVFALQRGFPHGDFVWPDARELLLIGINAGHLKTELEGYHSGISYLYKSSILFDMIDGE